jgi:hypothetical protein
MTKPTFSQYLRANLDDVGKKKACGPFVTFSFEYGCDGSEIGQSLVSRINARIDPVAGPDAKWILNDGQFLLQYAHDAGMEPGPDPEGADCAAELLQGCVAGLSRAEYSGLP